MNEYELMKILEGSKNIAYDCSKGFRTIGVGFNMEQIDARLIWHKLKIPENFDMVFHKNQQLSEDSTKILFDYIWSSNVNQAQARAKVLGLDYDKMRGFHKFILADIAYNTGSVSGWKKVFSNTKAVDIMYEARRHPKSMMDTRVAKIAYYFGIIDSLEDAHRVGLNYARYLV